MSCLNVCRKTAVACPVVSVLRAIWAVSLESTVLSYATGMPLRCLGAMIVG